jgi:hypothetical protein
VVVNRFYAKLLGDVLGELVRVRLADTPKAIASHIVEATGDEFNHQEITLYLQGTDTPPQRFISTFAEAFSLTIEERRRLAWVYSFSKEPGQE